MGIDLSSLFGQAQGAADTGMSDILQQGAAAGMGYIEQQTMNTLAADQAQHIADVQTIAAKQLAQPVNPNSFSAYLSNVMQGPVIKSYGPYILGGVLVIVVATLLVRGK